MIDPGRDQQEAFDLGYKQAIRDLEPWLKHKASCGALDFPLAKPCDCGLARAKEGRHDKE